MSEERRSSEVGDTAHLLSDFEVANSNSRSSKAARLVDLFHIPRWPVVCRSWKQFLFFLLPTFIQSRVRPHQQTSNKAQLHPTAWLDGMRGLAAFFVFLDHLSYSNHDVYTAWGTGQGNREFLKLPLIRYFYTGAAQVAVFFVVSGYALSTKPVRLMRSGEKEKLFDTLCSSVFRRAIRLYLPCFASTLLIIFLVRLGAYDWTRDIANDAERFPIRREHHPWRYDTLSEQLTVWAKKMWSFCNPYTFEIREGDSAIDIDGHLWTIPVEFRASLVLYLTQLGLSRLRPLFRISGLVLLISWAHQTEKWEMMLFFGGFLLAELDIRRRAKAAINTYGSTHLAPRVWSTVYVLTFLAGVYLGGQPNANVEHAPGWATLYSYIPAHFRAKQRYWTTWSGYLLVWSTSNHLPLQRIFTNGLVQYLGKISFPLYLVHGAVIHTVGYAMMDFLWGAFGRDTVLRKESGFGIAALCVIVVAVWAADLFMRVVDTPTVKFAKWLEEKCIVREEYTHDVKAADVGKVV